MKAFEDCLEGRFSNKYQAMKQPTRYAHINIAHIRLGDHLFYGEQAYNYLPSKPYRQFILKVVPLGEQYLIENYKIEDPKRYTGNRYLEELAERPLERRVGCDIIFKPEDNMYRGLTATKDCIVMKKGVKTYSQYEIELGDDFYWVIDRGFDCKTNAQLWGSEWGYLKFYRRNDVF